MRLALFIGAVALLVLLMTEQANGPSPTIAKLAQLIAQNEGFYDGPGAIPYDYNNPGDLTDWPGYPVGNRGQGNITIFPDVNTGWQALYTDLANHIANNPNQSILQFVNEYAGNPNASYAMSIAGGFGVGIDTPLSQLSA